jgi:MFS family permease
MAQLSSAETASPQVAADRWTAYSVTVWAICMLGFAFDIYEATIMQLVTPLLIKEWGIAPATIGNITTVSRWVGLIGIFVFPTLADLYGRRPVLVLTILGYSLFTGLTGFAQGPLQLLIFTSITRITLQGETPVGMIMVSETAPTKWRATAARRPRRRVPVRLHVVLLDGSRRRAAVGVAVSLLARNPACSAGFLGAAGRQGEPTF